MNRYLKDEIIDKYFIEISKKMKLVVFFIAENRKISLEAKMFHNTKQYISYLREAIYEEGNMIRKLIDNEYNEFSDYLGCTKDDYYYDYYTDDNLEGRLSYLCKYYYDNYIPAILYLRCPKFIYSTLKNPKKYNYLMIFYGEYSIYESQSMSRRAHIFDHFFIKNDNEISLYIEKRLKNYVQTKKENIFSIYLHIDKLSNRMNSYRENYDKIIKFIDVNQDWKQYYYSLPTSTDDRTCLYISKIPIETIKKYELKKN
jgi:hypothetical protein